jgi:ribosomal protein L11 methyltransferase
LPQFEFFIIFIMDYIELTCFLKSGQHNADLLIARLADIGFESFVENDQSICAYIPSGEFTEQLESQLADDKFMDFMLSFKVNRIPDQNWNAVWESEYDPVIVDNCMVRAPFHTIAPGIDYDILIVPKMSFGTAHHETTRLMMKYLLENELKGKSLLDMGSGTAVLAILAYLKGATPVTAIDNDEWAFNNALENVASNKTDQIQVLLGDSSLLKNRKFNIILANINRNILLNDIPVYCKCLTSKGLLFMSGFYEDDLPAISGKTAECGMEFISSKVENRWTSACFRAID